MGFPCLFSVPPAMNHVAPLGVSMVCSLFVMVGVVMLGGFAMVVGCMGKMF